MTQSAICRKSLREWERAVSRLSYREREIIRKRYLEDEDTLRDGLETKASKMMISVKSCCMRSYMDLRSSWY